MDTRKIALLDTDFTVKAIISQKDSEHHLIDLLMQYSDYKYVCHSKTLEEIQNHDFCGAFNWVKDKIKSGHICVYSDEDILNVLSSLYGEGSTAKYVELLKKSCDAFSQTRYQKHFFALTAYADIADHAEFLRRLHSCDEAYHDKYEVYGTGAFVEKE